MNPALRAAIARPPPRRGFRPPAQQEGDLHEAVADLLARIVKPPAAWTCFPAGNMPLPRAYAVKLTRYGLRPGWPDFILIHGKAYGVELKTERGRLSKGRWVEGRGGRVRYVAGQMDVVAQLETAGMEIAVCRSVDDVLAALAEWQIPRIGAKIAA